MKQPALPFPIVWLLVDAVAMLILAAGLIGVFVRPGPPLEVLAEPTLAWSLVVLGGVLGAAALAMIILHLREAAGRRTQGGA